MSQNLLTGIRDVDREILNKLDDREFLHLCSLNQTYYINVCDDNYFKRRTEARYPETIFYKREKTNWKKHYLTVVKYISLLETDFDYQYKSTDHSPELLYDARSTYFSERGYHIFDINDTLIIAIKDDNYRLVDYLIKQGTNIHNNDDYILEAAIENRNLLMLKYLLDLGIDIHASNEYALMRAIELGYLNVVKYLIERGADIHAEGDENEALQLAVENNYIDIVEYLEQQIAIHN